MRIISKIFLLSAFLSISFSLLAQKPELVIPVGNPAEVTTLSFSPDGKYIASGGFDQCIKLWDAQSGEIIKSLDFHNNHVTSVVFLPDSKHIVSAGRDKLVNCINYVTGKISYTLSQNGHTDCISSLQSSANGRYILTGSWDGYVKIWDTVSKKCSQTFNCGKSVFLARFSTDEKTIFISSKTDSTISLWNINDTVNPISYIQFPFAKAGDFIVHDSILICGSSDNDTLRFLSLKKLNKLISSNKENKITRINYNDICVRKISLPAGVHSLSISNNHEYLAAGLGGKTMNYDIYIWSLKMLDTIPLSILKGHKKDVRALCFSPDDKTILSGSYDRTMMLWNFQSQNPSVAKIFKGHTGLVGFIAWSGDDKNLLICYENSNVVKLFNLQNNVTTNLVGKDVPFVSVEFSPDNNHYFLRQKDGELKLWEIDSIDYSKCVNKKSIHLFTMDSANTFSYILSKGGDSLIFCNPKNKKIFIIDLNKNDTVYKKDLPFDFDLIDFSYDLEYFVFSDSSKYHSLLNIWKNDKLYNQLKPQRKFVLNLMITPDKKFIIAKSRDSIEHQNQKYISHAIDIWDMNTFEKINLSLCDSSIHDFKYFPGSKLLITNRLDGTIDLWDLASLQHINSYANLDCDIYSFFISNNKKLILYSGKDGKLIFITYDNPQKELATLTLLDSTDWVVTTPEGLFDASAKALDKIHYIAGLQPIQLKQLNHNYSQSNLLKILLGYTGEQLKKVKKLDHINFYPDCKLALFDDLLEIQLKNKGGGFGKVSVFIGNNMIIPDAMILTQSKCKDSCRIIVDLTNYSQYIYDTTNVITVFCENKTGEIHSPGDTILYNLSAIEKGTNVKRITKSEIIGETPSLYALVIGTSHYNNKSIDLQYADKDASDFGDAILEIGKNQFDTMVHVKVLSTDTGKLTPSKENIILELKDLEAKVKAKDIFVLYLSGHGSTANITNGDFYYMTREANTSDVQSLSEEEKRKATISTQELKEYVSKIPSQQKVIILDACESGSIVQTSFSSNDAPSGKKWNLEELSYNTGTHILAGSMADQSSYETEYLNQGVLTYSLLKGLKGGAFNIGDKCEPVEVMKLFEYAIKSTPILAKKIKGIQKPIPLYSGQNFSIGCANKSSCSKINIKENLIIFNNINFIPKDPAIIDTFNIPGQIKNYFTLLDESTTSNIAYINSDNYPDAYAVNGYFSISKNRNLEFKYYITKDKIPIFQKMQVVSYDESKLHNFAASLLRQITLDIEKERNE